MDKTHLAVALGVRAIENGFSVGFFRLEELLASMKRDAEVSPARLRRRKYINVALLVIDEVGFEPMSHQEASLLFRLVSYRHGRGIILITTNKGIRDWPEVLAGDEVLATAVLDRLLHKCHVFDFKGSSYRLRELERMVRERRRQSSRVRPRPAAGGGDAPVALRDSSATPPPCARSGAGTRLPVTTLRCSTHGNGRQWTPYGPFPGT